MATKTTKYVSVLRLRWNPEDIAQVQAVAKREELGMSDIVRRALREYMANHPNGTLVRRASRKGRRS